MKSNYSIRKYSRSCRQEKETKLWFLSVLEIAEPALVTEAGVFIAGIGWTSPRFIPSMLESFVLGSWNRGTWISNLNVRTYESNSWRDITTCRRDWMGCSFSRGFGRIVFDHIKVWLGKWSLDCSVTHMYSHQPRTTVMLSTIFCCDFVTEGLRGLLKSSGSELWAIESKCVLRFMLSCIILQFYMNCKFLKMSPWQRDV